MPSSTTLNANAFTEKARKDLLSLLESVPGKKNLVIQRALVGPIELLVKFSTLQEYGVDRIFFLENNNADSSQRNVVFLARGEKPQQVQVVTEQIKRLQQSSQVDHDFSVFWIPRRSLLARTILEEAGVLGDINVGEFPLYFQALEEDLLSLELDDSFKELYHRKDPTCVFTAAQALMMVQDSCGLFPRLLGKGPHAQRLIELLIRMRGEESAGEDSRPSRVPKISTMPSLEIDCLIVIDRSVDFSSGLLTQLTYEGLIDENFSIHHSQVELDNSITGLTSQTSTAAESNSTPPATTSKRKVRLDSSDKLYASLRDANFSIVGALLNRVARRLQADYTSRPDKNQTTAQLRDFVQKLPAYQAEQQSLKIHTSLAEEVLKRTRDDVFRRTLEVQQNLVAGVDTSAVHDIIEDLIALDAPLTDVLRLLCLESTTNGGMRQKDYERFSRAVVQAYGYQHMLTLDALGKMGLLIVRPASGAFNLAVPGMTIGMGMSMGLGGGNSSVTTASSTTQTSLAATNYNALRRPLNLVVDDVSEQDPTDIAYVYSGYAPLSIRLVQCLLQKPLIQSFTRGSGPPATANGSTGSDISQGWRPFDSLLQNVGGKTVDETQTTSNRAARARGVLEGRGGRKTSLVFFLGGITFAEVAALRFVGEQEKERRRIVIATTSVVSGERMVEAAIADGVGGGGKS